MPQCAVCGSPRRQEIELVGKQALLGEMSWRKACLLAGANNPKSLQNHMQTHFNAAPQRSDVVDRNVALKDDAVEMLLQRAEASADPDEKLRLHLKVKEVTSPNCRPDVILRIMKEERELDTQKGIAAALTMFGRTMFIAAAPERKAIEAEVIDVAAEPENAESQS